MKYFGPHHLLYALFALLFFVIFPALLLFLYPCHFFQCFLNATHCNFRIFMDVFQGNFTDGTNNTRDYRFFSGIFFLTLFFLVAVFVIVNSLYSILMFGAIITMLGFSVAILQPQRTKIHYVQDCIILMLLSLLFFSFIGFFVDSHSSIGSQISRWFGIASCALPLIYMTCLVCYWIVVKKKIPHRSLSPLLIKQRVCSVRDKMNYKNF